MGLFRWYKHDPRAFLVATDTMSNEMVGAYIRILNHLYIHDGKIPDDPKEISRWLRVRRNTWLRIRTELIERGKLYLVDGQLRNDRTDREMKRGTRRHNSNRRIPHRTDRAH